MDRRRRLCCAVVQVEAKLELGCIRHEAGMPWRIEHDFNMNFPDTGQPRELALHVGLEHVTHDLTELYGLPHGTLAKILQRLAAAGVLISYRGIKGGYTLARDPRRISVFNVVKASEGSRRRGTQREHGWHLKPVTGYCGLCQVSQVGEEMLRELKIEDIEEKVSSPRPLARCFIGASVAA